MTDEICPMKKDDCIEKIQKIYTQAVEIMDFFTKRDYFYPVTIVTARYGGTYEPGKWLAFPLYPRDLPFGHDEDDTTCLDYWLEVAEYHEPIGAGSTPDEAYKDMIAKAKEAVRIFHRFKKEEE